MQHDIDTTRERYTKIFSPRNESLESMINSLTAEARRIGVDPSEYISAYSATHPIYSRKGKTYAKDTNDEKDDGKNTKLSYRRKGSVESNKKETNKRAEAARADAEDSEQDSGEKPESGGNSEATQSADSGK